MELFSVVIVRDGSVARIARRELESEAAMAFAREYNLAGGDSYAAVAPEVIRTQVRFDGPSGHSSPHKSQSC